jgi:TolB protein
MLQVLLALALALTPSLARADQTYIPVGQARTKKTVIAFPDVKIRGGGDAPALAKQIHETVANDLAFMDLFKFLNRAAFIEPSTAGIAAGSFKLSDWSSIGAEFVVKASIGTEKGQAALEAYLYDTAGAKQVLAKRYLGAPRDARTLAHTFANDIVTSLTGLPGIFLTKIAMSCDRTKKKEIYVMDFDGTDVKQITRFRSIAISPAWSPDGTKIAFSLFNKRRNNVKNIDLYEYDFTSNTISLLSNRKGMNSGAAYSPDGTKIALTMSFGGNPDIYLMDRKTLQVTPLTKTFGVDVDPAWSPDGRQLAFVSSRTGMPMVHKLTIGSDSVDRLTYAGRYNASPSWSRTNNKIAFAGWIDGHFDIFLMNPDGSTIERLTKNQGNNEDPFVSPDGNFVVFSSNRTGQANIYVMNVDGTFVKRLTYGLGNCTAPKWSNPPGAAAR